MMSKEFLKKLGIFGVTLGLTASPLAFAQEEGEIGDEMNLPGDAKEPAERIYEDDEQQNGALTDETDPAGDAAEGGIGDEMDLPGDNKEPAERLYEDDQQQSETGEAGFGDGAEAMPGDDLEDDDLEDEEIDLPEPGETDDPLGQSFENTEVEE